MRRRPAGLRLPLVRTAAVFQVGALHARSVTPAAASPWTNCTAAAHPRPAADQAPRQRRRRGDRHETDHCQKRILF